MRLQRSVWVWGVVAGLTSGLGVTALTLGAPSASAGCEFRSQATFCDGPVNFDGTWDRCYTSSAQVTYGQFGWITNVVPASTQCYSMDPNAVPEQPAGQPTYHIFP